MGWNDRIDDDDDDGYADFLGELLIHLDGAAQGITKLVIDKGADVLSEKQQYIFERDVLSQYVTKECARCGTTDIPWCEMYGAHDNGGYCGYCNHMIAKQEKE